MNKIVWLTGPSGCGKTSIAQKVANFVECVVLDGDGMRKSISQGLGFSSADRRTHNLRVARLAKELSKQVNVLVCVIAPLREARAEIDEICHPIWVRVKRAVPERPGHFYEEPDNALVVDNEREGGFEDCAQIVTGLFHDEKKAYSLFIGRWQCLPPHGGHLALFDVVRQEGKNILIAIRDTKVDEKNPYTVEERIKGLKAAVPDAKLVVIPDITEVCYGRGVGYGVREIVLDDKVQAISGTDMRKKGKG